MTLEGKHVPATPMAIGHGLGEIRRRKTYLTGTSMVQHDDFNQSAIIRGWWINAVNRWLVGLGV